MVADQLQGEKGNCGGPDHLRDSLKIRLLTLH